MIKPHFSKREQRRIRTTKQRHGSDVYRKGGQKGGRGRPLNK